MIGLLAKDGRPIVLIDFDGQSEERATEFQIKVAELGFALLFWDPWPMERVEQILDDPAYREHILKKQ